MREVASWPGSFYGGVLSARRLRYSPTDDYSTCDPTRAVVSSRYVKFNSLVILIDVEPYLAICSGSPLHLQAYCAIWDSG